MKKFIIFLIGISVISTNSLAGEIYIRTNETNVFIDNCQIEAQSHTDLSSVNEYWIHCKDLPIKQNIILQSMQAKSLIYLNNRIINCPVELSIFGSDSSTFALQLDCRTLTKSNTSQMKLH
jgi:hypothetical protein